MNACIEAPGRIRAAHLGLMLAFVLLAPRIARADNIVICVANDIELATALFSAELAPTTIKLVQGSYDLNGTAWQSGNLPVTAAGTRVLGGYTSGCAGRDIARGNTILSDTSGSAGPLIIIHGDLTLEGLTWHTSPLIYANNIGDEDFGPLPGAIDLPPGTEILIRRSAFINANIGFDWGQDDDVDGTIRMVDTLSVDDTSAECAAEFSVIAGGEPAIELVNNTFIGSICAYNHYADGWGDGQPIFYADNNIFHSSNAADIYTNTEEFYLVDNMINNYSGPGPLQNTGSLSGNPRLDASYRPIESPPSPVINSGTNEVHGGMPASDLDGGARVVGSTVDRGAYESSISDELLQPVTNNNDSGAGSLRAAILSANNNGAGLVTFDIGSGCGPHVITLDSPLPDITAGMIFNGYTQPGTSANDLDVGDDEVICVILEAGNSGVTRGLRVAPGAGDSAAVSFKGLAFSGFSDAAIDMQGGSGHFVAGDHFGGSVGGHALQPNGVDIRLGTNAHDATIGSDDVANRNIIGGATGSGIQIEGGAQQNQIIGNYIGVGWNTGNGSYSNRANGTRGIHILGPGNTVSGNLIGYNLQAGILLEGINATGELIDGNFIGADAAGVALGNGNAGIHLTGVDPAVPISNTIRYNTIAHNGEQGVWAEIGFWNKIRKNAIYRNGGLGIDIDAAGVLDNDDDAQTFNLANRGQNYPVPTSAQGGSNRGIVLGTLTTVPGDYTVDIYDSAGCDASLHGEGAQWLKSATVTVPTPQSGDQGTATFSIVVRMAAPAFFQTGDSITATATDMHGDTSEFSTCVAYVDDTIFANGFEPLPH